MNNQATIANQLGVSQPTISRWLSGATRPSAKLSKKISDATGIPAEVILWGRFDRALAKAFKDLESK